MSVEDESTMADLWGVQQMDSESLKDFMVHFKEVLANISNIDNDSTLTALTNGLWHESKFRLEMTINRPLTIEYAIHRASNFVKTEKEANLLAKKHAVAK